MKIILWTIAICIAYAGIGVIMEKVLKITDPSIYMVIYFIIGGMYSFLVRQQ